MIRRYLALLAVLTTARVAARVARAGAAVLLMIAAAPVTIVAACAVTLAWRRGWPPRRLFLAAL